MSGPSMESTGCGNAFDLGRRQSDTGCDITHSILSGLREFRDGRCSISDVPIKGRGIIAT